MLKIVLASDGTAWLRLDRTHVTALAVFTLVVLASALLGLVWMAELAHQRALLNALVTSQQQMQHNQHQRGSTVGTSGPPKRDDTPLRLSYWTERSHLPPLSRVRIFMYQAIDLLCLAGACIAYAASWFPWAARALYFALQSCTAFLVDELPLRLSRLHKSLSTAGPVYVAAFAILAAVAHWFAGFPGFAGCLASALYLQGAHSLHEMCSDTQTRMSHQKLNSPARISPPTTPIPSLNERFRIATNKRKLGPGFAPPTPAPPPLSFQLPAEQAAAAGPQFRRPLAPYQPSLPLSHTTMPQARSALDAYDMPPPRRPAADARVPGRSGATYASFTVAPPRPAPVSTSHLNRHAAAVGSRIATRYGSPIRVRNSPTQRPVVSRFAHPAAPSAPAHPRPASHEMHPAEGQRLVFAPREQQPQRVAGRVGHVGRMPTGAPVSNYAPTRPSLLRNASPKTPALPTRRSRAIY
ncbi:hypothetical protein BC828DRAFT_440766 [Blastocladiella britannica]|nr:hypothetical protein BC828DRAFT_440766 [Blastocladiella britannica]